MSTLWVWLTACLLYRLWWPGRLATSGWSLAAALGLATLKSPAWSCSSQLAWAAGLALTWRHSTQPRSYLGPQFATWERLGLWLILLASWKNPAFLPALLVLLGRSRRVVKSGLHESLPIQILMVFSAQVICESGPPTPTLLLATLSAFYFRHGWAKLRIGRRWWDWIMSCRLHYQLVGAYCWGWMDWLPRADYVRLIQIAAPFNPCMAAGVVAVELSALGLGWQADFNRPVLVGLMLFHLSYLAITGAFFWENLMVLAAAASLPLGGPGPLAMLGSTLVFWAVFDSPGLTWWELPRVQRVYIEVVVQGQPMFLDHAWMRPFERRFYEGFPALAPCRLLTHNLSHTDLSQEEVEKILMDGTCRLPQLESPGSKEDAVSFLLEAFRGLGEVGSREVVPAWLQAPAAYLASGGRGPKYRGQGTIEEVRVRYLEVFYDGHDLQRERDEVVLKLVYQAHTGFRRVTDLEPGTTLEK